jgi:hypothetical protein
VQGLSPQTDYYVWVDTSGTSNRSGPFHLQVDVATTNPVNDTCAGALPLPFNTSVPGTNLGAAADYSRSNIITGGTSCSHALDGADVVYTFTTTTAGPVTVRADPQRGYNLDLAVMANSCAAGNCVATVDPTSAGDPAIITFNATANTTYYVIVDAWSSSAGGNNVSNPTGRGGFVLSVSQ